MNSNAHRYITYVEIEHVGTDSHYHISHMRKSDSLARTTKILQIKWGNYGTPHHPVQRATKCVHISATIRPSNQTNWRFKHVYLQYQIVLCVFDVTSLQCNQFDSDGNVQRIPLHPGNFPINVCQKKKKKKNWIELEIYINLRVMTITAECAIQS